MRKKVIKFLLFFSLLMQISVLVILTKITDNLRATYDFESDLNENTTWVIKAPKVPFYEETIIMVRHFLTGAGGYLALSYNVFGRTIEHPHSDSVIFPYYEIFEDLDDYQPWLRIFLLRTTKEMKPQTWLQHLQGYELRKQYFIGLELFHFITTLQPTKLLVLFRDSANEEYLRFGIYDNFIMDDEKKGFRIKRLGNFKGNTENWFRSYLDKPFVVFNMSAAEERQRYEDRCPMLALSGWWGGANMFCKLPLSFRGSLELYIRPVDSKFRLMEV